MALLWSSPTSASASQLASIAPLKGLIFCPKSSAGLVAAGTCRTRGLHCSTGRSSFSVSLRAAEGSGSLQTAVTTGGVTEVDKDSFWPIVEDAGDKVVVLDMYTQWCGPCKLLFPKILDLSTKYSDVVFLKLDCNQTNKPLAKELGVRVVPTFKVLKHKKIVGEITGAKFDELVLLIEKIRADAT